MTAAHRLLEVKSEETLFSTQDLFELIYSGAKEKNIKKIQLALRYACINVVKGIDSPAYQLAFECTPETNEALNFLIEIDPIEHITILRHMVRGYAHGYHVAQVEGILAKATTAAEYFTLLQFVISGYAQGGYEALAEDTLAKATHPAERLELLLFMAFGYAQGNHVALAEGLLAKAKNATERLLLLKQLASGYAQNGNKEQAECILALAAKDSKEHLSLLKQIAYGYARGGHVTLAKSALALTKVDTADYFNVLQFMAWGYARGGNNEVQIEDILAEVGDNNAKHRLAVLSMLAMGYAQSGHVAKSKSLLAKTKAKAADHDGSEEYFALLENLLFGYTRNGHIVQAEDLANHLTEHFLLPYMEYAYAQGGYEMQAEGILAEAGRSHYFSLLKPIIKGYVEGGYVMQAERILMKTTRAKRRLELLQQIAIVLHGKGLFLEKDSALFMLAIFNPKNQKKLAIELEKIATQEKKVNTMDLIPKAALLHPILMEQSPLTYPINYRDRVGFNWPFAQEWFLMTGLGLVKQNKLDNNLFFLISTFLAQISPKQAQDLFYKLLDRYRPTLFHHMRDHHLLPTSTVDKKKVLEEKKAFRGQ